jgi:hypothetical protein
MVNITLIVHIASSNGRVTTYPSCAAYFNYISTNSPPAWLAVQTRLRRAQILCEQALAAQYGIPLPNLANVCVVFGTVSNTNLRMRDEHTRDLVCNPNHSIVVQMKTYPERTDIISTIHRAFDYEIITHNSTDRLGRRGQVLEP